MLGALAVGALLWVAYRRVPAVEQGEPVVVQKEPVVEQGEPLVEQTNPLAPPRLATPAPAIAAPPARVDPTPAPAPAAESGGAATVEVMPAVSQSALDTVRGTIRIALRVSIDKAGAVVAVTSDEPGPSRYFERRSVDAASKWRFAPAQTDEPRSMRIVFAITRSGVTGSATPLP
jgi:TonB family protein